MTKRGIIKTSIQVLTILFTEISAVMLYLDYKKKHTLSKSQNILATVTLLIVPTLIHITMNTMIDYVADPKFEFPDEEEIEDDGDYCEE